MNLSFAEEREISEALGSFGLRESEQHVYLALLTLGKASLTPLSRTASLPLSTTQSITNKLAEMGIIAVSKHKGRNQYEALDPRVLRRTLEAKITDVAGIVPLLSRLRQSSGAAPHIRVYNRGDRVTDIFHEALGCQSKQVYEIVSAADFQRTLGEKFHFTRRRKAANVHLKSLRVEAHEIKKYSKQTHTNELREAKFLPRECTFRSTIMFWDDTVAFFSTKDEAFAWTVESTIIREMIEQTFDVLWSVGRRMETG